MKYLFICYPKCSTCRKAKKYLDTNKIDYEFRDIKEDNPSKEELKDWIKKSNLDIKKFFNTSGTIYRELNLKDKLSSMTDDEKIELLATDGMLVKRPILVGRDKVLVAFKEEEWDKGLNIGGNDGI